MKKGIVPAVVGLGISLALLYVTVRVISSGWNAGK